MSQITEQHVERDLTNGGRIRIRQGQRPIPDLVGRLATIVEIFRIPLDSCLVRIDGDADRLREWFLYSDELATI